jgi:hypothetical protein
MLKLRTLQAFLISKAFLGLLTRTPNKKAGMGKVCKGQEREGRSRKWEGKGQGRCKGKGEFVKERREEEERKGSFLWCPPILKPWLRRWHKQLSISPIVADWRKDVPMIRQRMHL